MPKRKTFEDPDGIDEQPEEVITEEHLFAGADHDEDEEISGDRGDDPDSVEEDVEDLPKAEDEPDAEEAEPDDGEEGEEAESDDEGEEDDEDEDEDESLDSPYVSKDRFNAVNERMKLAEEALAKAEQERLEASEAVEVEKFDFDAKEREYMELVNDGEYDKAAAARREIRAAERAEVQADLEAKAQHTPAQVAQQVAFTNKVAELADEFDAFNPEHENYDQVLVDEAITRRSMFEARGLSPADALEKAALEVAKLYDVESKYERLADEEIARQDAQKPTKKKADVKKKVAQANRQPSKMDEGSANSAGQKAVPDMDEAEFDALPESTKARLRGDIL